LGEGGRDPPNFREKSNYVGGIVWHVCFTVYLCLMEIYASVFCTPIYKNNILHTTHYLNLAYHIEH